MSTYAISDTHGNLPEVPADADLLLLGGDLCPDFFPSGDQRQAHWLDTAFRAWLEPIAAGGVEIVAIWGNHDFVGEKPFLVPDLPWTLLQDREHTTKDDIRVYGTPWVPGLPRWAFFGTSPFLEARADAIPEGLDILISHGPPYMYGDYIPTSERQQTKYGNYGGQHVGDIWLTKAIRAKRPAITICGHIHEARGRHLMPSEEVVERADEFLRVENCAAVDAFYDLHAEPWVQL